MTPLKVDFHVHTGEDPKDTFIKYSARQLLRKAAEYQFDAITIANHGHVFYTPEIKQYADELGILLIPGMEAFVEQKHVLLVNCPSKTYHRLTFQHLRAAVGEHTLIIAPHPFFPRKYCLQEALEQYAAVFDAIEFAYLYYRFLNFNTKAVAFAHQHNLPMVGTSDSHDLRQLNTTYSLVEAEKNIPSIIEAVRAHRVQVVTQPLSTRDFFTRGSTILFYMIIGFFRKRLRAISNSSE